MDDDVYDAEGSSMETIFNWAAPIATTVAAFMVASNIGARVTGLGFVVYCIGSVAWMGVGWLTNQPNLLIQNGILMTINVFGIWRWLGLRARYDKGAAAATDRSAQ